MLVDVLEDFFRAVGDIHVERRLGQRRAGQVAHHEPRVRGAEIGDEHDAGALVEGQHGRGTSTGRGTATGLVDQLMRQQSVQPLGYGGASQTSAANQIGSSDRLTVADEAEQGPRARQSDPFLAIDESKAEQAAG